VTDTRATTTFEGGTNVSLRPDDPEGTAPQSAMTDTDDADFAELPPKRRVPALTKGLIVGILVVVAFGGGVMIQKQHDAGSASASSGFPSFAGGIPAGAGAGGGGASNGGASGGSTAASGPVVVGTVVGVAANDVTVKDLGGSTHVVHVSATTGLATTSVDWSTSLKPGTTVSINGTKADDGTITATTVTQR
jgi:hypothetical protein